MESPAPTVQEMFQQMLVFQQSMNNSIRDLANGSITTNTRLDSLVERVQALELAQSLMIYPSQSQPQGSNPMNSYIHDPDAKSRTSSPIPSDKESSVAEPGTSEDLAAVLDAAADTPTLTKRNSASGKTRRDSFYVRQLGSDENEVTIKYHTKYRDVLKHLEALLEYEHKYRIKLPLARTVSQDCIDQILSRFNLSDKQFHDSSLCTGLPIQYVHSFNSSGNDDISNQVQQFPLYSYKSPHGIKYQLLCSFPPRLCP